MSAGDSFLVSFYENFFGRDLSYIIGGAVVIASVDYALFGNPLVDAAWVTRNGWRCVFFLGASYLVGVIAKEFFTGHPVPLFRTELKKTGDGPPNYLELRATEIVAKRLEPRSVRLIERHIFLEHIGAVIGSSLLVSAAAILLSARGQYAVQSFWVGSVAAALAAWGVYYNRKANAGRRALYSEIRRALEERGVEWTL